MGKPFPGLDWIDDVKSQEISDIVYRAGQILIREQRIDWSSTCGNMMAAVAIQALNRKRVLPPASLPPAHLIDPNDNTEYIWPVRILAHDTGKVFTAHVPVTYYRSNVKNSQSGRFGPSIIGDAQIAGVPGRAPGIMIESPLQGRVLPTGNERDTIEMDGKKVRIYLMICSKGGKLMLQSCRSMSPSSTLDFQSSLYLQSR